MAFESTGKDESEYAAFKEQFEADAVADVRAKRQQKQAQSAQTAPEEKETQVQEDYLSSAQPVDLLDAAARLAYQSSRERAIMNYPQFKVRILDSSRR